MNAPEAIKIFPILFVFIFLSGGVGFVLHYRFLSQLRSRHPETWETLGRPTFFLNNSLGNNMAVLRFLWRRDHRTLGDEPFARFARFLRGYLICYLVLFLAAMAAFLFEARVTSGG